MLQKLTDRHLDIIRRLIVGQTQVEIARDLGTSQPLISTLLNDPLFAAKLAEMRERTMEEFVETRRSAMEILQEAAPEAAETVVDAFRKGRVRDKEVGAGLILNSAFDVLDRTGNKAIEKSLIGKIDLGQLIAEAYKEKRGGNNGGGNEGKPHDADEKTDNSFDLVKADANLDLDFEKDETEVDNSMKGAEETPQNLLPMIV